jgi:hypothetical protein
MHLLPPELFLPSFHSLQLRRLCPSARLGDGKLGTILYDLIVTHEGSQSSLSIVDLPTQ